MGKVDKKLKLNNRERMIRACLNEDIDRVPFWFMFGPWGETLNRWKTEGLENDDWSSRFNFDSGFAVLPVNLGFYPKFDWCVLSEEPDGKRIVRNDQGITYIERPGKATIPYYLDYPIKTREDWEIIKAERLNPDVSERFPDNWKDITEWIKSSGAAVQVGSYPYGLFGMLRDFMGVEDLLTAFYDDPELIHDMMDYLTDFWIEIYKKMLLDVQIDHIHIWEDMSGKQGPLISPKMFREFMKPNYIKIADFAKKNKISVVSVDTDGNMDILMPLLEESGINLVLPFEVRAGCDIVALKREYPNICMHGGIDKLVLEQGREAIDCELDRVSELFNVSGYIPGLDHLPHPDISFQNFTYFVERLRERVFN